ncbi:MAG TPA: TlpA disulfide reductase family protein [Solirubrobacteraceae bacterium]|nr:TlpA disulfide reductase family protein [Solirubrobacteraceae bacterium]
MKNAPLSLLAAAVLAAALVACGGSDDDAERPAATPPPATTATAPTAPTKTTKTPTARTPRAPLEPRAALARNATDANRIVGSGRTALQKRLASLEGHPVVVNQWASWCGPCRHEFPFFARAVRRHGDRVAFLGIDYMDSRDAAQAFIEEQPPGFPSIFDRDGTAARAAGGGGVMPTTLFIGPDGKLRHRKLGGYAAAAELEADIRRYSR